MIDVKLPDIGEGIAEGEIVKWSVQAGDTISKDQPLLEILTDKASVEIPAPAAGTVSSLLFDEGDLVPVGSVIARIQDQQADNQQAASPHQEKSSPDSHALATPSVRRLAMESNVDLSQIQGSGPYGRISREDVEKHSSRAVEPQPAVNAGQSPKTAAQESAQESALQNTANETRIPLRGIRRKIADQMVKAKFTAPDFFYGDEADLTELVHFRKAMAEQLKPEGIKLTYLPFIIKAVISGLKAYPTLNASLDDEAQEVVMKHDYNIGFATDSPNGLFVPVIHHADRLSIIALSQEIQRLAEQVREGKASSADMRGGTFTLTNIGAIGGIMCSPIINHPEVGIMGINKIYQKPMVYEGEIAIRWACNISLSFDHRVVDGADGARFCNHVIQLLQNPQRLLLET
jgi:pyruvate/2-oxoglutarate dehydrogenase complex dihydrolipoamide acyltransferase (E2) component